RFLALKRRFKLKKRDASYTKRASSRYEILGCGDRIVSAPDMLIEDVSDMLFPVGKKEYLKNKETVKRLWLAPTVVKYLKGDSPLIVSQTMYASAAEMGSSNTILLNFNITCQFVLDGSHPYLICLHFSDIVSKSMNELDVFLDVSMNGLEILRVNNSVDSLDGEFGAAGRSAGPNRGTVAKVVFAMMFAAFVGLGAMTVKLQKRPQPNLIGLLAKGSLECRSW
ncbi:hypothetical protein Tco_0716697, partial [Tanacetum coccineum]